MELIKDKDKKEIRLVDDGVELFSMSFFFDEFIWSFSTDVSIMLSRDVDEKFYDSLASIMNSKYSFGNNGLSSLSNDRLVWFSDQTCDFEDEEATERVSRLVIEKEDEYFKISIKNPFFTRMGINRVKTVAFSPMGNGYYTKNEETGSTFQDDIVVNLFWKNLAERNSKQFVKKGV